MEKYSLLPQQLLYEGTCNTDNFFEPQELTRAQILRTHSPVYWQKLQDLNLSRQEERKTGFPLSEALVKRELRICGGTIQNAYYALKHGISMNIAGGTHHAYTDHGEGFCLLNDIALASHELLDKGLSKRILVIDLDVHQGNGTAEIMHSEERVFTFSMHGEKNYPLHKEQSNWDIALPDGTDDAYYLKQLQEALPKLLDNHEPDFIFFQSGVDVLESDKLGRLSLSRAACKKRDELVLETCKQNQVPVVVNMGGGYSERISDIVEAHANTFRLAQEIYF